MPPSLPQPPTRRQPIPSCDLPPLDRGAAARHLGGAEARIFSLDNRLEPRRQRRPIAPFGGHALARAIVSGLAASRSSTSLPTAMLSTFPVPSTGSLSSTQTSEGIIRSE